MMEAIILAGGKAERLGAAAEGRPKPLVQVGGRPLVAHQVAWLAEAGVERVVVSCAAGDERLFETALAGFGPEIVAVGEPARLGRATNDDVERRRAQGVERRAEGQRGRGGREDVTPVEGGRRGRRHG